MGLCKEFLEFAALYHYAKTAEKERIEKQRKEKEIQKARENATRMDIAMRPELDTYHSFDTFQYQQVYKDGDVFVGIEEVVFAPNAIALIRVGNDRLCTPQLIKEILFDEVSHEPFIIHGGQRLFIDKNKVKPINESKWGLW